MVSENTLQKLSHIYFDQNDILKFQVTHKKMQEKEEWLDWRRLLVEHNRESQRIKQLLKGNHHNIFVKFIDYKRCCKTLVDVMLNAYHHKN